MKILQVHNFYQRAGGEDQVIGLEAELLRSNEHQLIQFTMHNDSINKFSKAKVVRKTLWNAESYKQIEQIINKESPDVCHIHNTFPLISPSVYYACQKNNTPIVQTLHNYRLFCPNGLFFRDSHICEDCLGKKFTYPGILHACYHDSRLQTSVVSTMLSIHHLLGTWSQTISIYISLSKFSRRKFIEAGLPKEKIIVSRNFLNIDIESRHQIGDYALFVGRLSNEKGLMVLLKAWEKLSNLPLKIIGYGPMIASLKEYVHRNKIENVCFLGRIDHQDVIKKMKAARLLILPSECYENFPLTILEAYACGLPVIASRLGAVEELILEGKTGLLFEPGNPQDLADKVCACWDDEDWIAKMGTAARVEYEQKYTKERKYESLMHIYKKAIDVHRSRY